MGKPVGLNNPCVGCGACCAHFRVQFYWREAEDALNPDLYEDLDPRFRCMKGTNDKHHPKCTGLRGRIGRDARCLLYGARPTPCREFKASFSDGRRNERCDEARAAHGLRPLTAADWR